MVRSHKSRLRVETRTSQRHRRGKLWNDTVCLERIFGRTHLGNWVAAEPSPYCYHCRDLAKAHKKTGISWPAPYWVDVLAEAKKISSPSKKKEMRLLYKDSDEVENAAKPDTAKTAKGQRKNTALKESTSHGPKAERIVVTDDMIQDVHLDDAKALFHNSRSRVTRSILPETFCTSDQKDLADLQRRGYISDADYCTTGGIGLEDVDRLREEPTYSVRYVKSKPRKGRMAKKPADLGTAEDGWAYVAPSWSRPESEWDFLDDSMSVQSWVELDSMSDLAL